MATSKAGSVPEVAFTYTGDQLRELAFPLGGIGTGCISLEGRGALRDWEIFNRPNKGFNLPMTFGALWYRPEGDAPMCRVVQGPPTYGFVGTFAASSPQGYGKGLPRVHGNGLPHFAEARFTGTFPFARIDFHQPACPLSVQLEAFSPFVPLDEPASSMPVASLTYRLKNVSDRRIDAVLAFNMMNGVGYTGDSPDKPASADDPAQTATRNSYHEGRYCRGIHYTNEGLEESDPRQGSMALSTDWPDVAAMPQWHRPPFERKWYDHRRYFWWSFSRTGELRPVDRGEAGQHVPGTIGLRVRLEPGEAADLPVLISWCFPTFERYWQNPATAGEADRPRWTNRYARRWPDAWAVAEDFYANRASLTARTAAFERALNDSTLPPEVIESVGATATTLRTPTCLQYEDGTFWGFEGCDAERGCCPGSCTHVWNYALTQAYLQPALQRTMRRSEHEHGFPDDERGEQGGATFRIPLPLGDKEAPMTEASAVDGQLGGVIQFYRDWRISGDDAYLRELWPAVKKALEYAWHAWDRDRSGVLRGAQHNTYDIAFHGPNPLGQFMYLGALRAGEAVARHVGDTASADEYRRVFEAGRERTQSLLFNGEFFEQALDVFAEDAPTAQQGKGCLTDQLLGQWSAEVAGLGRLTDAITTRTVLRSIYQHNFRDPLGDHENPARVYAVADEPGLLLCSWPRGERPENPFAYADEVWTGIEYQAAAHMIHEGLVEEGLRITRGVRNRHDGRRRNPYNEFECGSHYARALASWGLLLAMSGVRYDAVEQTLTIDPRGDQRSHLRSLFTTGPAWGVIDYAGDGDLLIEVVEGELPLRSVHAPTGQWAAAGDPHVLQGGTAERFALGRPEDASRIL